MAAMRTGISRDLIFHPGVTIAEILEERDISQIELANTTGVSPTFVSNVISGKKNISANFAQALEYALGIPKSFWLNLQANYDAELLEVNELQTITSDERIVREELKDIVKYLRSTDLIPSHENKDASILSLRKALKISNLANLGSVIPVGSFKFSNNSNTNTHVLGAWVRMCQIAGENRTIHSAFDRKQSGKLIDELKTAMFEKDTDIQKQLKDIFAKYGIDYSLARSFPGAPVQGYVSTKSDGSYQMVLTIQNTFADEFWFSLFHELGHIVNGDISKKATFLDAGTDSSKETAADDFAKNALLQEQAYFEFISRCDFTLASIEAFSNEQNIKPFVVIDRLQKEGQIANTGFSNYKTVYDWLKTTK